MAAGAQVAMLPDGRRLHLNHGPIDLIVEAFGARGDVQTAYGRASDRFATILEELVAELAELRRPFGASHDPDAFRSAAARRMARAVARHSGVFVTPMAAVAGAVADEVLAALAAGGRLERAYVNNGGDIALYLTPGQNFTTGLVGGPDRPASIGTVRIGNAMPARGIATSGRGGRSLSLGIADSVTVIAADAAGADVAATLIANAVNIDHPAIERRPACELDPDSDLGRRLVTVSVGRLERRAVEDALRSGEKTACEMRRRGVIEGALLMLDGEIRTIGHGMTLTAADDEMATPA